MARILRMGVDPGTRRIGTALSEPDSGLAYPHKTLDVVRADQVAQRIVQEAEAEGVAEIVMGLPLHLDGSEGQAARRARAIAAEITQRSNLPVMLWDERLSTVAAERALRDAQVASSRRRRVVDQVAATLLLQSYLDANTEREWIEDRTQPQPLPTTKADRRRRRGPGAGGRSKR